MTNPLGMIDEQLKPCPFCGHSSLREGLRNIYCTVCGAEGPVSGNEPPFDWNSRVALHEPAVDEAEAVTVIVSAFTDTFKGVAPSVYNAIRQAGLRIVRGGSDA